MTMASEAGDGPTVEGTDYPVAYWAATRKCWGCGQEVKLRAEGRGDRRWLAAHRCWLHWIARRCWASYLEGWHEGYRWAVENPSDPLVLSDAEDYGTGWAGHMRVGYIAVVAGDPGE